MRQLASLVLAALLPSLAAEAFILSSEKRDRYCDLTTSSEYQRNLCSIREIDGEIFVIRYLERHDLYADRPDLQSDPYFAVYTSCHRAARVARLGDVLPSKLAKCLRNEEPWVDLREAD